MTWIKRICWQIILLPCIALFSFGTAAAQSYSDLIMTGTAYQTEVIITCASVPGPAVMVLGGVHGNEPAGSLAAEKISQLVITRGTLIVIPRVNKLALYNQTRTLEHIGDVNRAYPGKVDGTPSEQIAYAIDRLLAKYRVSMLIDLHEGRAFHRLDNTSVGQTILFAANDRSAVLAMDAADYINRQISERHRRFTLVAHPVPHSAAHYAAERYHIAAFTLETAGVQPLPDRVAQHVALVRFLLQQKRLL